MLPPMSILLLIVISSVGPARAEIAIDPATSSTTEAVASVDEPEEDEPAVAPDEAAATAAKQQGVFREQAARLAWRLAEEIRFAQQVAERERDIVDRRLDAVLPLEAPKRGDDLRSFIGWYDDYLRRLEELGNDVEREYGRLMAGGEINKGLLKTFGQRLVQGHRELDQGLRETIALFQREEGHLRQLIARRQSIDYRHAQLIEQLISVENRLRDPLRLATRQDDQREANNIRDLISHVREEMLVTPAVREDTLAHYEGIIVQAQAEREWLQLKLREFQSLEALLNLPEGAGRRFMARLEDRFRQLIMVYEVEVASLKQKIDQLDEQRAAVVPFGSLRELDKARELWDNYLAQKRKFEEQIRRAKTQIGALEAEMSQLQTLLRR